MNISVIYHHAERHYAEDWELSLKKAGCDAKLAPLGYQVGSDSWQTEARKDIEAADGVLLLITPKAVNDKWFLWRLDIAINAERMIFPVEIEDMDYSEIDHGLLAEWQHMICLEGQPRDGIVARILSYLPKPPARITCFISYSREDEEFAARIAYDLRGKDISVWRDADSIRAGASWDNEIQNALNNCTHVLLIATPRSVESSNVGDEIGYALFKRKTIIPLILEECELPMRVHRAQYVDFRGSYDHALWELWRNLIA